MSAQETLKQALESKLPELGVKRDYQRGDLLIQPGKIEHRIYFVESGCLRIFYLDNGEEHNIRFGYSGNFFNALDSYLSGSPTQFYIEAIRKTSIYEIPKQVFLDFMLSTPEKVLAYQKLTESMVIEMMEREVDLMIKSPSERLERVRRRSPKLFQEVPLKYIANYLRMTPETLSRLQNS